MSTTHSSFESFSRPYTLVTQSSSSCSIRPWIPPWVPHDLISSFAPPCNKSWRRHWPFTFIWGPFFPSSAPVGRFGVVRVTASALSSVGLNVFCTIHGRVCFGKQVFCVPARAHAWRLKTHEQSYSACWPIMILLRAGLSIVPVVPYGRGPNARGPNQLAFTTLCWRSLTTKKIGRKKCTPRATALRWYGSPEWLIRPWFCSFSPKKNKWICYKQKH